MVIKRPENQGEAWAERRVDKRIQVVSKAGLRLQSVGDLPLVLRVEAQPVFAGEFGQEVAFDAIVPVVDAVGQPVARSEDQRLLHFDVITVPIERLLICSITIHNLRNAGPHGRKDAHSARLVHAGPPAAYEKIRPLIHSMDVSYLGLLVDGHDIHDGSVIPVRIHEAAGQPHSRITCERVICLNVELMRPEGQGVTPPPLLILVPAEGEPVA